MEKLRFHDNDSQIIDEISHHLSVMQEFYDDEYNSVVLDGLSTIFYNDVNLHEVASEIIGYGDYTDDGAYVYSLQSKYLANRKVDYAELRFKYVLNTYPNYTFTQEENIAVSYTIKLIYLLRYILKYSYRATYVKKIKTTSKKANFNRIKSKRPRRTERIKTLNEVGVFDDYPSFIGSFAQPNPISCDGEDQ